MTVTLPRFGEEKGANAVMFVADKQKCGDI